jgi:hypothetical protein
VRSLWRCDFTQKKRKRAHQTLYKHQANASRSCRVPFEWMLQLTTAGGESVCVCVINATPLAVLCASGRRFHQTTLSLRRSCSSMRERERENQCEQRNLRSLEAPLLLMWSRRRRLYARTRSRYSGDTCRASCEEDEEEEEDANSPLVQGPAPTLSKQSPCLHTSDFFVKTHCWACEQTSKGVLLAACC